MTADRSRASYTRRVREGVVTSVSAPPESSLHRVPKAGLVDRIGFVLERARGRRVIHLGFVDETRMDERVRQGSWLHAQLARVAEEVVGIDISAEGVRAAAEAGYEVHQADCEDAEAVAALELDPADIVLAGELVEHLTSPGRMLDAVRPFVGRGGELIVTTPNAYAFTNVLAGLIGREFVNADHVGWQSWRTGTTLLERHGYTVRETAFYPFPRLDVVQSIKPSHRRRVRAFNAYLGAVTPFYRLRPSLADGLILVATPTADQ
jgi:SAM-dependent methyltransferase